MIAGVEALGLAYWQPRGMSMALITGKHHIYADIITLRRHSYTHQLHNLHNG